MEFERYQESALELRATQMSRLLGTEVSKKTMRWTLGVGVFILLALGLVLLFLLTQATQRWDIYEQNYTTLFVLNTVVASFLLGVIVWILWRLFRRWRSGKFGSQLLMKLASIFMVVGFIPGLLIYAVSYQFVSRSIEAWFDVEVEGALDAGLKLGRATLDALASDLGSKTVVAAGRLSESLAQEIQSGKLHTPLKSTGEIDLQAQPSKALSRLSSLKAPGEFDAGQEKALNEGMDRGLSTSSKSNSTSNSVGGSMASSLGGSTSRGTGLGLRGSDERALSLDSTAREGARLRGGSSISGVLGHDLESDHAREHYKAFSATNVERLREQLGADEVVIWSNDQTPLASAGGDRYRLSPERPTAVQWKQLKSQKVITLIEGLEDDQSHPESEPRIKALAMIASPGLSFELMLDPQVLEVTQKLPSSLVKNALALQAANAEYQERALAKEGLSRMYIGTLTLTLFLSVFGAVLLAVILGNQMARPLLWLVSGVRDVASGDLSPKPVLTGKDELEGLTRSFAQMTQQLFEARNTVEKSMEQVDLARANLQTILDHLTAGVLVLGHDGRIISSNPGATRILKMPMASFVGKELSQLNRLGEFAAQVLAQFKGFEGERNQDGQDHWQQSFDIEGLVTQSLEDGQQEELFLEGSGEGAEGVKTHVPSEESPAQVTKKTTILARGAILPNHAWLLVFDDISEIVSAQRAQAWGEVARRLAHEIKNPLTPIQLSAERLEMKLSGKLEKPEQAVLMKSVKMIVDQVDAMKRLVNEFRDYARLPQALLQPLDLNALLFEVVQFYGAGGEELETAVSQESAGLLELTSVEADVKRPMRTNYLWHPSEGAEIHLELDLDPKCGLIKGDALQVRQVVHNLLQNAQDATEGLSSRRLTVSSKSSTRGERVRLVVTDSGPGFPDFILKRAFEPYVTTKAKGTGLGLAVVKKIADDHGARINLKNLEHNGAIIGAQVSVSFEVAQEQHVEG